MSDPKGKTPPPGERPGARQTDPTLALDPANIPEEYAEKLRAAGILKPKSETLAGRDATAPAGAATTNAATQPDNPATQPDNPATQPDNAATQPAGASSAPAQGVVIDTQLASTEAISPDTLKRASERANVDAYGETLTVNRAQLDDLRARASADADPPTPADKAAGDGTDGQLADTVAMDLDTVLRAREEMRQKAAAAALGAEPASQPQTNNSTAFNSKWLMIALLVILAAVISFLILR
ncbi:MAG: hypothetical protein KC609_26550 [Myxococcales bacterium]|nr:hypothetical protein [Myxococcales bacterium]